MVARTPKRRKKPVPKKVPASKKAAAAGNSPRGTGAKRSSPKAARETRRRVAKRPTGGAQSKPRANPGGGGRRQPASGVPSGGLESHALAGRPAKEGPDWLKVFLGVAAAGGAAIGVLRSVEAKQHAEDAQLARQQASTHRATADTALRHAESMEAEAAHERRRAELAEERARKLAIEVASAANKRIALLCREDMPRMRFEGCAVAATNGDYICINIAWVLSGIVDPAIEAGSISGRMVGVVAHEWYHFLDTARGTRPPHDEELAADAFAGRQLAKLGVPPQPLAELLRRFRQSSTHPSGDLRADTMLDAYTTETRKLA